MFSLLRLAPYILGLLMLSLSYSYTYRLGARHTEERHQLEQAKKLELSQELQREISKANAKLAQNTEERNRRNAQYVAALSGKLATALADVGSCNTVTTNLRMLLDAAQRNAGSSGSPGEPDAGPKTTDTTLTSCSRELAICAQNYVIARDNANQLVDLQQWVRNTVSQCSRN